MDRQFQRPMADSTPNTGAGAVLGVFVQRLLEYERDVWLLVIYFLGFRLGDPILDLLEHDPGMFSLFD